MLCDVVPQIRCVHTGYYQNPKDCTQFVACLFDHNTRTKVSCRFCSLFPYVIIHDIERCFSRGYTTNNNNNNKTEMEPDMGAHWNVSKEGQGHVDL